MTAVILNTVFVYSNAVVYSTVLVHEQTNLAGVTMMLTKYRELRIREKKQMANTQVFESSRVESSESSILSKCDSMIE
jgi:hypothetical protein